MENPWGFIKALVITFIIILVLYVLWAVPMLFMPTTTNWFLLILIVLSGILGVIITAIFAFAPIMLYFINGKLGKVIQLLEDIKKHK